MTDAKAATAMGLRVPRGKFERLDVLLPAKLWRTDDRADPPVAAACRNLSSRGCRVSLEDAKLSPGFDVESSIQFSIQLDPHKPSVEGGGRVAWLQRERGQHGKVRLILGIEYTAVSSADRERIKAHIAFHQIGG